MANTTPTTTLEDRMKAEAVKRMKALRIMPNVIRDFENGTLNYSERQNAFFDGILYWIDNVPEFRKAVDDYQKRTGSLVYHAQLSHTTMGDMLSLLYVSRDEAQWARDMADIREGYAYCYVCNMDCPDFSEHGTIGIKPKNGGVTRTA